MKEITFIIPSCNFTLLQACIDSIIKYTDFKIDAEFIIVANGLPIEAKAWLDNLDHKYFKYIWHDNKIGESASVNEGEKLAESKFVAKMDDDNELLPAALSLNWISILLEPFKDEKVGLVGPGVFEYNEMGPCCVGFLMVTRKEIWDKIGGFDPDNILAGIGTDTDLSFKIIDLGYTISLPKNIGLPKYQEGKYLGGFPIWHKSVMSHSVGAAELRAEKNKILAEILKERWKRLTGYWGANVQDCMHAYSAPLANWMIEYLNKDKDKGIHDFGCGFGNYLKAFKDAGFTKLCGYEGEIPIRKVFDNIIQQDLTKPFTVSPGNCICLEVLEHIPEKYTNQTLNNITNACNGKLIMSWAVRGQAGNGHVNCLNNKEVIDLIIARGFKYFEQDSLSARSVIDNITPWFQNTIMIFEKE